MQTDIVNGQLRTPTKIPEKVQMIKEEEAPPPVWLTGVVGGVPGGVPGGQMGGVIGEHYQFSTSAPVPKVATPQRVRVSQGVTSGPLTEGSIQLILLWRVPPASRAQYFYRPRSVKLAIFKTFSVISGHPMLVQSALDAVKQWKYRPYYLNGEPVEVDTTIEVNFSLAGG